MPLIESQKFYQDLEKGEISPLYFIYGEEPFLLKQAYHFLRASILQPHEFDFNFQIFYGEDLDLESLKDSLQTLPMMAVRRLVILKDADAMPDSAWEELFPFFETPIDSTVFAIFASKVDKRKKSIKTLLDRGTSLEFKKPYDNQIPSWIRYIAGLNEVQVDDEAIHEIHRRVGSHLLEIESALKKLKDFMGKDSRLTLQHVLEALSITKEESVFRLIEALGHGDRAKSLEILVRVLDQDQNEVGLISLIARHFRLLYQLKRHQAAGVYGSKLAQALQIPPYFLNQYLDQGHFWTESQIEQILVILSETDRALKSSPVSAHIWLENLVLKATSFASRSKGQSQQNSQKDARANR